MYDIEIEASQEKNSSSDVRSTTFNPYSIASFATRSECHYRELMNTDFIKYFASTTPLKGYLGHFFSKTSKYRVIKSPHSLQDPGYPGFSDVKFRHQDSLGRIFQGPPDDRFLNPIDGAVKELVVQCTDRIFTGPRNSTYKRTCIRNVAPITLRIANWPMSHLTNEPQNKSQERRAKLLLAVKWPVACYALNHFVSYARFLI